MLYVAVTRAKNVLFVSSVKNSDGSESMTNPYGSLVQFIPETFNYDYNREENEPKVHKI